MSEDLKAAIEAANVWIHRYLLRKPESLNVSTHNSNALKMINTKETVKYLIAYSMFDDDLEPLRERLVSTQRLVVNGYNYLYAKYNEQDYRFAHNQKALIVSRMSPSPTINTPGSLVPDNVRSILFNVFNRLGIQPDLEPNIRRTKFYIIQLIGPLFEEWRRELAKKHIKLLQYFPTFSYLVELTDKQFHKLSEMSIISHIREFRYEDKGIFLSYNTLSEISDLTPESLSNKFHKKRKFNFLLHVESDLDHVLSWLKKNNLTVTYFDRRSIGIELVDGLDILLKTTKLPEIQKIEEENEPELFEINLESSFCAPNTELENDMKSIPYTGKGQLVGVADGAIDDLHSAFTNKINGIDVRCKDINANLDKDGHGSHVSGIAVGNFCGIARESRLYFQVLRQNDYNCFGGVPKPLDELFDTAYKNKVRIHNNSWGSPTSDNYPMKARDIDHFVLRHPDMLIVVAVGNYGQVNNEGSDNFSPKSISDLAAAKNALTVGASDTNLPRLWPESSRGPTIDDLRLKPDIVAPGTNLCGPKSSHVYSNAVFSNDYVLKSGTSQAAAIVSGCAAIIRQYYIQSKKHHPSAALLKATIINSTNFLECDAFLALNLNIDMFSEYYVDPPNSHQGFGNVCLHQAIPNLLNPQMALEFIDTASQKKFLLVKRAAREESRTFEIESGSFSWLRICLTWTDIDDEAVQNHLGLWVLNENKTEKWIGNRGSIGSQDETDFFDNFNNVQVVRIKNPKAGKYLIKVVGLNVPKPPQDFALVVTGSLKSKLTSLYS